MCMQRRTIWIWAMPSRRYAPCICCLNFIDCLYSQIVLESGDVDGIANRLAAKGTVCKPPIHTFPSLFMIYRTAGILEIR